jgi:aspartyl-tRNA(Asn)/glutamyl-tRNA(Gln) amidotransferase subunit C
MLAFAMPQRFTTAEVQAIADLAHLELSPEELELFARQLSEFLTYAEQVQRVDTGGVPPTTHVATTHVTERDDATRPCLSVDEALGNAPDRATSAGLFRVPRVIG